MSESGSKAVLKWREPKRVSDAKDDLARRKRRAWERPVALVVCAFLFTLGIYFSSAAEGKSVNMEPITVLTVFLVCLGIGFVIVYAAPFLSSLAHTEVRIDDEGIGTRTATEATKSNYEQIDSFRIASAASGDETTSVLSLKVGGEEVMLGIAPEVDVDDIRRRLTEHGVAESVDGSTDK